MLLGVTGAVSMKAAETSLPIVQVSNLKYSYNQMQQDLATLQERYPGQMVVDSLGTTADGRDITEVILGDVNAEHHILIQATMHAREYMNTVLAMNQIEDYLSDSETRSYEGQTWKEIFRNVFSYLDVTGMDSRFTVDFLVDYYANDLLYFLKYWISHNFEPDVETYYAKIDVLFKNSIKELNIRYMDKS